MTSTQKQGQGVYITTDDLSRLATEIPKKLTLQVKSLSASRQLGYHLTRLRGRGMSFAESRAYQPGDEIRHIDWRVTARTGITHTKTFEEERDRPIFIVLDQTASQFIGSTRCFKAFLGAELAAGMAWLACRNQDRFGGIFVGNTPIHVPMRSGRRHWGRVCEGIIQSNQSWDLNHDSTVMDWKSIMDGVKRDIRPGSLVIFISDFFGHNIQTQDFHQIRLHSDILCIGTQDPIETNPPTTSGVVNFAGVRWFYRGADDRSRLQSKFRKRWTEIQQMCASLGIGFFSASTEIGGAKHIEAIFK